MPTLNGFAVVNVALLRAIQSGGWETLADLARGVDRHPNHINRDLGTLKARELVDFPEGSALEVALTAEAEAQLAMIDRAEQGDAGVVLPPNAVLLTVDQIADGHNARTDSGLSDASIEEMADSQAQKGILQPIVVRPAGPDGRHVRVIGERRHRGWRRNVERGTWAPDRRWLCLVFDGDALEARLAGVIENVQREDLTNLEQGEEFVAIEREHGLDGEAIARLIGKKDRFVQIAMKVAREASEEDKAAFRASEAAFRASRDPKDRTFPWTRLRDSVGAAAAKPKPSLELSPKLARAMVEVVEASLDPARACEVRREPGYVRLARAYTGGELSTLSQRGLINTRLDAGECFVKPMIASTKLGAWLDEIGYSLTGAPTSPAARATALRKVRAATLPGGELEAQGVRPGHYLTELLNLGTSPLAGEVESRAAAPGEGSPHDVRQEEGYQGYDPRVEGPPEDEEDYEELEAELDAGYAPSIDDGAGYAGNADRSHDVGAGPGETPAQPELIALEPEDLLLMVEVEHKTDADPVEPPGRGYRGCAIGVYPSDPRPGALIAQRLMGFGPGAPGGGLVAYLTEKGRAQLDARGFAAASDEDLQAARRGAARSIAIDRDGKACVYLTDWLNPVPSPAPGEAEKAAGRPGPSSRDAFSQSIVDAAAEERAERAAGGTTIRPLGPEPESPDVGDMTDAIRRLDAAASNAERILLVVSRHVASADDPLVPSTDVADAIALIGEARELAAPILAFADDQASDPATPAEEAA